MQELKYIRTDKNGTIYYHDYNCTRCGGAGQSEMWHYTGKTCYKCDGAGKLDKPRTVKVHTPEYAELLEAKRIAKHDEKMQAARAEGYGKAARRYGFGENGIGYIYTGNTYEIKEQLRINRAKYSFALHWVSPQPIFDYPCVEIHAADIMDFYEGGERWDINNDKAEAWLEAHNIKW